MWNRLTKTDRARRKWQYLGEFNGKGRSAKLEKIKAQHTMLGFWMNRIVYLSWMTGAEGPPPPFLTSTPVGPSFGNGMVSFGTSAAFFSEQPMAIAAKVGITKHSLRMLSVCVGGWMENQVSRKHPGEVETIARTSFAFVTQKLLEL